MDNTPSEFDPSKHVEKYRRIIAERDKQPEGTSRTLLDFLAQRLREEWKERRGEDNLHSWLPEVPRSVLTVRWKPITEQDERIYSSAPSPSTAVELEKPSIK